MIVPALHSKEKLDVTAESRNVSSKCCTTSCVFLFIYCIRSAGYVHFGVTPCKSLELNCFDLRFLTVETYKPFIT